MSIKSWFSDILNQKKTGVSAIRMLEGKVPIFSQFGDNVYASDIAKVCINRIVGQVSKLQPRHIFEGSNGLKKIPRSTLNRLFKYGPNPLMTTDAFINKVMYLLMRNYNSFIYPMYIENDLGYKVYTALYPLDPKRVVFLMDGDGVLFIEMSFMSGDTITLPYSRIIHLRKEFSEDGLMGGGISGTPDNAALLKTLELYNTITEGLAKSIVSSMQVSGVVKLPTVLNTEASKAEIAKFESLITSGKSGLLPLGIGCEYVSISKDPKIIDEPSMRYIEGRVLAWYGVSKPIYDGDFTDDEFQAWYEICLNLYALHLGNVFTKCLFTQEEFDRGNYIEFFPQDLNLLSMKNKLDLIKTAGEQGLLSDDQKLQILGLPPVEGGQRYTQSLNYINKAIIDQYQLKGGKGNE